MCTLLTDTYLKTKRLKERPREASNSVCYYHRPKQRLGERRVFPELGSRIGRAEARGENRRYRVTVKF